MYFVETGKQIDQLSWTTFTAPFHWKLWIAILLMFFGESIILWKLHNYPTTNEAGGQGEQLITHKIGKVDENKKRKSTMAEMTPIKGSHNFEIK